MVDSRAAALLPPPFPFTVFLIAASGLQMSRWKVLGASARDGWFASSSSPCLPFNTGGTSCESSAGPKLNMSSSRWRSSRSSAACSRSSNGSGQPATGDLSRRTHSNNLFGVPVVDADPEQRFFLLRGILLVNLLGFCRIVVTP